MLPLLSLFRKNNQTQPKAPKCQEIEVSQGLFEELSIFILWIYMT